jgi:hypothetical protein
MKTTVWVVIERKMEPPFLRPVLYSCARGLAFLYGWMVFEATKLKNEGLFGTHKSRAESFTLAVLEGLEIQAFKLRREHGDRNRTLPWPSQLLSNTVQHSPNITLPSSFLHSPSSSSTLLATGKPASGVSLKACLLSPAP